MSLNNLSCSYLEYVIKESLRHDPPTIDSVSYKTYADVEICGVSIPKDMLIFIDIGKTLMTNDFSC